MYLSTTFEGGGDIEMSIRNGKVSKPAWLDPVGPSWTQSGGREGYAIGGIRDKGEEGGKYPHQP